MKLRTTFRTKLLLLTIVPLGVALLVTLLAVMHTVEQDVETRARESLNTGANVVNEFLAARNEQLRTSVTVLAANDDLKEAAATGDAMIIRSLLNNHGAQAGADIAALLGPDGSPIASTRRLGNNRIVGAQWPDGDSTPSPRESVLLIGDDSFQVFAVPMRAPTSIGWVELGFRIDHRITNRIAGLTGLDTSIVRASSEPSIIVTTRDTVPETVTLDSTNDFVFKISTATDTVLAIQTPFDESDSGVLVLLERSMSDAMQPYVEARRGLIAFGTALLICVVLAVAWFSKTIAAPLRTLSDAARRMISGDYNANVAFRSDDEFGDLAMSFDAMQSAISEREQRISHHAMHDSLTDLPNRARILQGLTAAIEQARKNESKVAVLSIRLVRMSEISSTLGHNAADELIKMAARHLQANIDEHEIVGHTGTNEFVLILPGRDVDDAMSHVDRIEGILGSGVTLDRINVILQTEIGVAEFPCHGDSASDLLRFASIARTEAQMANERVHVYEPGREDEFLRRLRIVNDLPGALRRGDVQTWFQPKAALPGGVICGAEALVRWQHPELGWLNPDDFVPAAEQSGTIVVLTRHVLSAALSECSKWEHAGHTLGISVNLSARDLLDEYLPYHVMQLLNEHNVPAGRLTLEVTESSIMENLQHAVSVLECLRDIGVHISMDDFGTGHSSLAQLRNIPLHELKIDKSFIVTLHNDTHNQAIVRTTVNLAHSMKLTVVAEGVEDESTMRRIVDMGCEQAQGFFLSKPLPSSQMLEWLVAYEPIAWEDRRGPDRAFRQKSVVDLSFGSEGKN